MLLSIETFCPFLFFLKSKESTLSLPAATFVNNLDPDREQQNVISEIFFLKRLILKKVSRRQQRHEILPSMQRDNRSYS